MISLREIPMVRWIFPLILGILVGSFYKFSLDYSDFFGFGMLLFILIQLSFFRYLAPRLQSTSVYVLVFLFGTYLSILRHSDQYKCDEINLSQNQWYHIGIESHPKDGYYLSFRAKIKSSRLEHDSIQTIAVAAEVKFVKDSLVDQPKIGDQLLVFGKLDTFKSQSNPHAFDYKRFINNQGVYYQLKVSDWKLFQASSGYALFLYKMESFRARLLDILDSNLRDENSLSIAAAMTLGYRNNLSDDLYETYANTGTVHILAVSGLHVGIVASMIYLICGWIRSTNIIWRRLRLSLTLMSIWGFALLSGFGPAVFRAAIMFSIFILAGESKSGGNPFNIIAFTAFLILLMDPSYLFQIGFQLSFLAVISIVYFTKYMKLFGRSNYKVMDWIRQALSVTMAAQFLVMPLVIFYFHRFPWYFLLSSLVAVPAAYLIIWLSILLFTAHFILPSAESTFGYILSSILRWFNQSINAIEQLPWSSTQDIHWSIPLVCCLYLLVICWMRYLYSKRKFWIASLLIFSIIWIRILFFDLQEKINHQSITVYDLYNGSMVDFISHGLCFSLCFGDIDDRTIKFVAKGNRIANGVKDLKDLKSFKFMENADFKMKDGLYQLDELIISIPDHNHFVVHDSIDIYILTHEVVQYIYRAKKENIHESSLVILDRSVRPWHRKRYLEDLKKCEIHDIAMLGAYQRVIN